MTLPTPFPLFSRRLAIASLWIAGLCLGLPSQAATLIFDADGNATNGVTEGTGGSTYNWTPGSTVNFYNGTGTEVASGATDIVQFGNGGSIATSPAIINVGTGTVGGLVFGATTNNGYTLNASTAGQVLTLGGNGISMNLGALTTTVGSANLSLALNASETWNNASASLLTIGGNVDNGANQLTVGGFGAGGVTLTGVIGSGTTFSGGLTTLGTSTVTLSGANLYTGATVVSTGSTLKLNFSAAGAPTSNIINNASNSSSLTLNGGTLNVTGLAGATDSQQFNGLTLGSGGSVITLTQNSAVSLSTSLGAITRSAGGTLNFSIAPNTTTLLATTSNPVSTPLGVWATTGSATSMNYATVNASGQIVAMTTSNGSTSAASAANLTDTTGTVNYDLTTATGTMQASFSGNSIRYTGGAATTAPGATLFSVNGLLNSGTGLWTIGTNGITIGANKELVITTGTNGITITSVISNNAGGASGLTYSGLGPLTLSGVNLYTGATTVNSGTLNLGVAAALNSASTLVVNGGTFGESTFADTVAGVSLRNGSITGSTGVLTSTTAYDLQNGSASAILAGSTGAVKTTLGTVVLSGANTFIGGLTIKQGTVSGTTSTSAFGGGGTGAITLGDSTANTDAKILGDNRTFANPITLASNTTGTLTIGASSSTAAAVFSGGITGTNNLTLNSTGGAYPLTLSSVNIIGTVTNAGTGTGTATITALGTNVVSIVQASSSPFTITNAVTPSATMSTFTSTGTGLFTLTGGIGSGTLPLVFNTNSTGGITVTGAIATTGTITSSGTGTGNVTLTAALPSTITNVVENGNGVLTLSSGANAYTGTTTVTSGTLSFAGTPVTGATSGLGNSSTNIILGGPSTTGALTYTGSAATMTRNFTINAGGGQVTSTTATLTLLPGTSIDLTNGPLTLGGASGITVGSATTATALFTGTNPLTKIGAGTLTLSDLGGNVYTAAAMPINITQGSLALVTTNVVTASLLGSGVITITPGATLTANFAGATTTTLANPITIAAASGTANISVTSGAFQDATGAITFAAGSTSATILKLNNSNTSSATLNLGGTVTGTGSIQLNPSNTASAITLSGAQNQTGTITNVGSSTSTATLSGAIGSGITGISQAGANPFTVSSTGGVPVSATLNTFTSTGAGAWTFSSGFNGAGSPTLTLNANSSGSITSSGAIASSVGPLVLNTNSSGGITLSGAVNNTGSITNSGTGEAVTTISGAIGATVTNVIENSAGGQLVLSGTNAYTGTASVTAGILDYTTTLAIPGYSGVSSLPAKISVATGTTLALPFGGYNNTLSTTDIANLLNGTVNLYPTGSSLGIDTTNASSSPADLSSVVISNPTGVVLGFTKTGTNSLLVNPANTYTGPTAIVNGTLVASVLGSVGATSSSLGAQDTIASATLLLGQGSTTGTLSYTGPGETTDRVIHLAGTNGGGGLDQSGSGLLKFTSNMVLDPGAKTLTLSGSTSGTAEFAGTIPGTISTGNTPLTIAKTGTGSWLLSGTSNTATTLAISGGVLDTGSNGLTLGNTSAATIQGNGVAGGAATINGKIILTGVGTSANGGDVGATVAGFTLIINAVISGGPTANVDYYSGGTTILNGANTYQGQTQMNGTTLEVFTMGTANGAAPSSLGQPSGTSVTGNANSTILMTAGTLKYMGVGETTDRVLDLRGLTTAATLDQSGTGLLKFTANMTAGGAGIKVFTLQGSTTGTGEIAGAIVDNSTTNTTGIAKAGTGTWTLSGTNTYTGPTTVNGGNLIVGPTGALANTAITVNSGGTLSPLGNYVVGNIATAAKGGSLTLAAGGTLNLADGTINSLFLVQNSTFSGNAASFNGGTLMFDVGATLGANDVIDVRLNNASGTGLATSSGLNTVVINPIGASLAPGNYTLISAAGTLNNANFYLASPNVRVGGTLYNLSLSLSGTNEILTVATGNSAVTPANAFWAGTTTASWSYQPGGNGTATNWVSSATATTDTFALPAAATNVTLTANTVGAGGLSTTLDGNFTINSLTFSGAASADTAGSSIAPGTGGTLTINAAALNGNTAGNGITVASGAGASTISANVILGASQTWTNNSTNPLTVSGIIDDAGAALSLTIGGTGTFVFSAANTYSGITTLNGGVLSVGILDNGGKASGIGDSSNAASNLVFNGGTLRYTGPTQVSDRNFTINAGTTATFDIANASTDLTLQGATGAATTGILTKIGLGTLTLAGANTYTGNTVVNAGTLDITGSITGLAASSALVIGQSTAGNAVVNVSGNFTGFATQGSSINGGVSVYNQTSGTVTLSPVASNSQYVVKGVAGAYGMFDLTGGTYKITGTTPRFDMSSANMATGFSTSVAYVGGGSNPALLDGTSGEWFIVGYSLGQITVLNNGTIDHTGSSQPFALMMDTSQVGGSYTTLNMAGGTLLTGAQPIRYGNSTTNGSGNSSFINLASGVLSAGSNSATSLPSAPSVINALYVNYAGGTLKSSAALTQWSPTSNASLKVISTVFGPIDNSAVTGAPSFNGGAVFDTTGGTITLPANITLNGASGVGVTQDDLTVTGGSGYVGAPAVQFSKPASANGVPASGYALMSGGSVVGIVITEPGVYAPGETPTITLTGGGASTPATVSSDALSASNSNTGGLTKLSNGTLSITGSGNTFGGAVDIKGGILAVTTIANGGLTSSLGNSSNAASNLLLDGGVLQYASTSTAGVTDRSFTLAANGGGLDASGTVAAATFTLTAPTMVVAPELGSVSLILQGSGTASTGYGVLGTLISDGTGTTVGITKQGAGQWNITNNANTYSGPTVIASGVLSVGSIGTAGAGGTPSSLGQSSNAAANLVLQGGTLQYTGAGATMDRNYTFGNATTAAGGGFDSEGTGPWVITGSMTGANVSAGTQTLTLTANAASGANSLNSAIVDSSATSLTGVTKSGAGTWTLAGANNFSGATTMNAGTLTYTGTNSGASPITLTTGGAGTVNINSSGTVNAGAISWAGATSGTVSLNSGIFLVSGNLSSTNTTANLLTFNGGTLESNAAITISTNLPITIQSGGGTVDTTGGSITSSSTFGSAASPGAFNVVGGNTLQTAVGATLTGPVNITGTGTTLRLATTAATYTGVWTVGPGSYLDINNVGNFSFGGLSGSGTVLNTGASAVRTVTITGTGGTFSGSIQQPTPSTSSATGVTINLSAGTTQIFNGANTYGGPTAVNGGTLAFTGGSLGNTAISVTATNTFAVLPGSGSLTAGNNLNAGLGASLNLPAASNFSMVDGAVGTFNLVQNASFATAALTLASANLNLELSSTGADQIVVSGGTISSAISGTNVVNITSLGATLTPGTYNLISAPGIAAGNTFFKFNNGLATETLALGSHSYPLTLTSVAGIEQLLVGTGITNLTWTGQTNGVGAANSVWTATPIGNNNFADPTPVATDYTEGSAVSFNDLNVISGSNVTNKTVTVDAAGVNPGSLTVNNSAVNYIFQNASGTVGIAGAATLTKTGSGTLTLLGVNTFTGGVAINGGIVNVGVANSGSNGPLGASTGPITFGGGTLQYSSVNQADYSSRFSSAPGQQINIDTNGQNVTFATALTSPTGTLTVGLVGGLTTGTLTITTGPGTNTYTGTTVINAGTLKLSSTATASSAGILSGTPSITINNGGTLLLQSTVSDLLGYTAGREALIINGGTVANNGTGSRITLANPINMTGGTISGTSAGDSNTGAFSINSASGFIATSDASGNPAMVSAAISTQTTIVFNVTQGVASPAADMIVSGNISPYASGTNGITKNGNGVLTLSGANTYKGTTTILKGVVNANSTQALGNNTAALTMGDTTNNAGTLNVNQNNSVTTFTVNSAGTTLNTDTINIASGKTLTVTGNVAIGPVPTTNLELTALVIGGGGAWNVATAASGSFRIGGNNSATANLAENATLDLTGLASTSINVSSTGTLGVGNTTATNTTGNQATLLLPTPAVSNTTAVTTITAANFNIGDGAGFNSAVGQVNAVVLGTGLTTLNVNTLNIGTGSRDIGTLTFANSNGTLKLRAADGSSRTTINIGTGGATTGTTNAATNDIVDFTGHSVDLLINTLNVGNQARVANLNATFSFDTGTLNATGVTVGFRTGTVTTTATLTDTINLGGGTVTIGTGGVDIGNSSYNQAGAAVVNGTVNITGGVVTIGNSSTLGAAVRLTTNSGGATNGANITGTLSITGGTVTLGGDVIKGVTTGVGSNLAVLTLDGGVLDLGGHKIGSATASVDTLNLRSGALQNVAEINNGGAVSKTSTGTLTLAGTNTFSGAFTVSAGILNLTGTAGSVSSGAASTFLVNGGATLSGVGTIGSGATTSSGGTLAIAGGSNAASQGVIDLRDNTIGTLTILGNNTGASTVTLTLGGSAGNSSVLNFDISNSSTDQIAVSQSMLLNAGGAIINLNQLSGTLLTPGTYNLITFAGDTLNGAYTAGSGFSGGPFTYTLNHTSAAEQLVVTSATLTTAYWKGDQSSVWNTFSGSTGASNWYTDATGSTNSFSSPSSATDVYFSVNSGAGNFTNTLGADTSIKSLNFTSSTAAVTIGAGNTLTIGAAGINDLAATAQTINVNLVLGSAQTWVNSGSGLLTIGGAVDNSGNNLIISDPNVGNITTVTGSISGSGGLTKTGSGQLNLTGTNSYTGGATLSAGTLQLGASGTLGSSISPLTVNGGALDLNGTSQTVGDFSGSGGVILNNNSGTSATLTVGNGSSGTDNYAGVIADDTSGTGTVSLVKTGSGVITLSGLNTFSGSVVVTQGTLAINTVAPNSVTPAAQSLGKGRGAITLGNASAPNNSAVLQYTGSANANLDRGITLASGDSGTVSNTGGAILTLSAAITGASSSTFKISGSGASVVNITQDNAATLSAPVVVTSGTLAVNNPITSGTSSGTGSGSVTVSGGALTGAGSLGGTVTIISSAKLTPGAISGGVATLTFDTNLTLSPGSTTTLRLAIPSQTYASQVAAALAGGVGFYTSYVDSNISQFNVAPSAGANDYLNIMGTLTTGGTIVLGDNGSYFANAQIGDSFKVLNWQSIIGNSPGNPFDLNGLTSTTRFLSAGQSIGDVTIGAGLPSNLAVDLGNFATTGVVIIVPEPSRVMLLLLGLCLLGLRRSRR